MIKALKLTRSGKWIIYDWANSAFALTIMSALFPLLFRSEWSLGESALTTDRLAIANSVIGLVVALFSPILASFAAVSGNRKSYLIFWSMMGIVGSFVLSVIPHGSWIGAIVIFGLARIGFQFATLFYDAMLADVTSPARYHRVSSLGYAFGYMGCAILFAINLLVIHFWQELHFESVVGAQRFAVATVAVWWLLFSLPLWSLTVTKDPSRYDSRLHRFKSTMIVLKDTVRYTLRNKNILLFLLAYWFYIDGVHTVILMATEFGMALGFKSGSLLTALLYVQLIAFPSAIIMGWLAEKFRAKTVIAIAISIYLLATGVGGIVMQNGLHFTLFAVFTGVAQGGIQALSRSLYSTIIPKERFTELTGIYNMVGRFAVIVGPLFFVGASQLGSRTELFQSIEPVRIGLSSLSILFFIGLVLLGFVREPRKGELAVQ